METIIEIKGKSSLTNLGSLNPKLGSGCRIGSFSNGLEKIGFWNVRYIYILFIFFNIIRGDVEGMHKAFRRPCFYNSI